ncbi:DNA cytosine methyltransferase [Rossellomorea yichunensis]|uniref:DNA cytosine methyltransferase n=1 Tax=Rossellomorea yichunensis TaxID=3077331 RepID=UPI0028DD58CB|nr:DNA cytosine methyltransferase [Rossellomorea sp. YC4-1]MDT9025666.1 DNA cytosine methyltransferase [Rossellomorea sp. YC4-1]
MAKLNVLDLFAGAGGLSDGFIQTDQYEIKMAVEINKFAKETYKTNHRNVKLISDITKLEYFDKSGRLKENFERIDIIIGGPPCQGFSNANRQKNTLISNNNQLVKEYLRAIECIRPKAFVMENVKNMSSSKHKFFLTENDDIQELKSLNIELDVEQICIGEETPLFGYLKDFIFIVKKEGKQVELSPFLISHDLFSKLHMIYRKASKPHKDDIEKYISINKKYFENLLHRWEDQICQYWHVEFQKLWFDLKNVLSQFLKGEIKQTDILKPLFSVLETQRIISKMKEVFDNEILFNKFDCRNGQVVLELHTINVFKYVLAKLKGLGYKLNEDDCIFNAAQFGVPQTRRRLVLIGIRQELLEGNDVKLPTPIFKEENEYFTIKDAIGDLEEIEPGIDVINDLIVKNSTGIPNNQLNCYLNASYDNLHNHVVTNSTELVITRFKTLKEGQNFHDLDDSLKTTFTDSKRTQNTIYKKMSYNRASDTVVNVRKSMWSHPKKDRAISIREAARLQSFRDNYIFKGSKDAQYQQVGNAVPPILARFIAESVISSLGMEVRGSIERELLCRVPINV